MFSEKYNKGVFHVNTKEFSYVKLAELYATNGPDVIYHLDGLFIIRSKMGEQPVFICAESKQLVNIPAHKTQVCRTILNNPGDVMDIKSGRVGFTIYEYESHGKKCYSINFVDLLANK